MIKCKFYKNIIELFNMVYILCHIISFINITGMNNPNKTQYSYTCVLNMTRKIKKKYYYKNKLLRFAVNSILSLNIRYRVLYTDKCKTFNLNSFYFSLKRFSNYSKCYTQQLVNC